jgi:uncharacterized repeat protein (TIGR03803 family)
MKTINVVAAIIVGALASHPFDSGAQTLTTLYQFGGSPTNGSEPVAGLVQGSDGYFYGTTFVGGTNGDGVVFRISSAGILTALSQFGGSPTNGSEPVAGLVQGSDSYFYGTTEFGGTNNKGVVFRISSAGTMTTLWQFGGSPTNGAEPIAALVQGSDGYFYGTTTEGGTNNLPFGDGTLFRISSAGTMTTLWQFGSSLTDGAEPAAGLVQSSDGNFYGTTFVGGTNNDGVVFRINSAGTMTTLWQFGSSATDGARPRAGLMQGSDGYFYGTTSAGGMNGTGVVFRISSAGTLTTLCPFGGSPTNGAEPIAGLVQGSDGNFYGTTSLGGTNNEGVVFRINSAGTMTTLWQFSSSATDGARPRAGLVQGSDGYFYGTTSAGATNSHGTVFRLTVPLNPPPYPINQITSALIAATNIIFTIPSIAGETYQLQHADSMNPTNWVNVAGASITNSIGALMSLTNFGGASQTQGFYRFDITP